MTDRLIVNTPELSDRERQWFFGGLSESEQGDLADLFWQCATPEQRQAIYRILREWYQDMRFGVN